MIQAEKGENKISGAHSPLPPDQSSNRYLVYAEFFILLRCNGQCKAGRDLRIDGFKSRVNISRLL